MIEANFLIAWYNVRHTTLVLAIKNPAIDGRSVWNVIKMFLINHFNTHDHNQMYEPMQMHLQKDLPDDLPNKKDADGKVDSFAHFAHKIVHVLASEKNVNLISAMQFAFNVGMFEGVLCNMTDRDLHQRGYINEEIDAIRLIKTDVASLISLDLQRALAQDMKNNYEVEKFVTFLQGMMNL